jgi:hypothetical protein
VLFLWEEDHDGDFLSDACEKCGVELAHSQAESGSVFAGN